MKESTRKAGEERWVRLRQEQKEGGGGACGRGHSDSVTFAIQGGVGGGETEAKGGGGWQRDGDVAGGGGWMKK